MANGAMAETKADDVVPPMEVEGALSGVWERDEDLDARVAESQTTVGLSLTRWRVHRSCACPDPDQTFLF